jgi:iron(III) transport system permease protein
MLVPGLLAAAGIVFALTTGELGATLLVAPPGQATLTIRIYNFLHYGASSVVAGLCLMMAVTILIAGIIAVLALAGRSNLYSKIIARRK